MTSTTTVRPTSTPTTDPARETRQRRNRRIGSLVSGGLAVAVLAAGAVIWAAADSQPESGGQASTTVTYVSEARAGALVGHGTQTLPADAPIANAASDGALVGHGTTVVVDPPTTPAVSDADAGALVGNRRR